MNLATSRQSLNNVVIESDGVRNLRRDERSRSCLRRRICVRFREDLFFGRYTKSNAHSIMAD